MKSEYLNPRLSMHLDPVPAMGGFSIGLPAPQEGHGECNSAGYIVKEEAFSCVFLKMNMIHLPFHVPQTFMYFSPCGWSLTKIIVKIRAIRFPTDGACMYVSLCNPRETRQRGKTLATSLKELPVLYKSKHPASYSAKCTKIKITQEE